MPYKYLKKIGVDSREDCVFNCQGKPKGKKRRKKYAKQREKHGFDVRETWSMDYTLVTWLYEHLSYYLEHAPIDFSFNELEIPAFNDKKRRARKKRRVTVTQGEAIELALKNLRFALKGNNMWDKHELEAYARIRYAMLVLAELMPYLWW